MRIARPRSSRTCPRRARRTSATVLCISIVGTLLATTAQAATYKVGAAADLACTHHSIRNALLAAALNPGPDLILIATNQPYTAEDLVISNQSVGLIGGYSNCADTTPSPSGTTLDGLGGRIKPIVEISRSSGAAINVSLLFLNLANSDDRGVLISGLDVAVNLETVRISNSGGDGIRISGTDEEVRLSNVSVQGSGGRGIHITGAAASVALEDVLINLNRDTGLWVDFATASVDSRSLIANNSGINGAGVRCIGGDLEIEAPIFNNTARATGGAIRADAGCVIHFSGDIIPGSVFNNTANSDGGAIYAASGSQVFLRGDLNRVWIHSNRAEDEGGAIYATGTDTLVQVRNAQVDDNTAGNAGGGVFVTSGATVTTDRFGSNCQDPYRCMTLSGNRLDTSGPGSALRAEADGRATLLQTFVEGGFGGSALSARGGGTTLRVETVQLWDNFGRTLFEVVDGASLVAGFVSGAQNVNLFGSPRILEVSAATASLFSSVFDDARGITSSGASLTVACTIANDTSGFPASSSNQLHADPKFQDPAAGNLHLQLDSPAVDFCSEGLHPPTQADMDFETRGFDHPSEVNVLGPFDLGIDEATGLLFQDGFERGDTSRWSSSSP